MKIAPTLTDTWSGLRCTVILLQFRRVLHNYLQAEDAKRIFTRLLG